MVDRQRGRQIYIMAIDKAVLKAERQSLALPLKALFASPAHIEVGPGKRNELLGNIRHPIARQKQDSA